MHADKRIAGAVLGITMMALLAPVAKAIPPDPDNAALLYYQGFLALAELDDDARELIGDVARGKVDPNDRVRQYLDECRGGIEFAEAAARVRERYPQWRFVLAGGVDEGNPTSLSEQELRKLERD